MRLRCLYAVLFVVTILGTMEAAAQNILFVDSSGSTEYVDPANPGTHGVPEYAPVTTGKAGTVTFNVYYDDVDSNTNYGFDDPTYGTVRQTRVSEVVNYLASILDESGSCDIRFTTSQSDGSGALATGGTYFFMTPGWTNGVAFSHITTGTDPSGSIVDVHVVVDFGWSWYQGTDTPAYDELDFTSVLLHEITHGLGILSLAGSTGASTISSNVYSNWDNLLVTGNGQDLFGGSTPAFLGVASDLLGNDGGIVFTGTNATAIFGSNPPIYAPGSWESGSSLSHWNTGSKIAGNAVMEPVFYYQEVIREYANVELGALEDLGYTLAGEGEGEGEGEFEWTSVPQGGWYEVGDSLSLSVACTGTVGTVNYQWLKDSAELTGENAATLEIESLTLADGGWYSCRVDDESIGKGTFTTTPVHIEVFDALPAVDMRVFLCVAVLLAGLGLAWRLRRA